MSDRPVVYVTQDVLVRGSDGVMERKFDFTTAEKFGTIRVLIPSGQSLFSSVPIVRQLKDMLRDFSERDFLLPLGDPSIMMAAGAIAASISNGRMTILKWDRRAGIYLAVPFDVTGREL